MGEIRQSTDPAVGVFVFSLCPADSRYRIFFKPGGVREHRNPELKESPMSTRVIGAAAAALCLGLFGCTTTTKTANAEKAPAKDCCAEGAKAACSEGAKAACSEGKSAEKTGCCKDAQKN
jgi:hypothetical protein